MLQAPRTGYSHCRGCFSSSRRASDEPAHVPVPAPAPTPAPAPAAAACSALNRARGLQPLLQPILRSGREEKLGSEACCCRSPLPTAMKSKELRIQIPHHFRCPISLDLMRDPVTLSTGQTYDRESIEKWVEDGNSTCPATMQRLHDKSLIPNHTLRRLIQEWCVANRSQGVERIPTPKQPADPDRVAALLREVKSGAPALCLAAVKAIRALAKESDKNRLLIARGGAAAVLMDALSAEFCRQEWARDGENLLAEEALAALAILPLPLPGRGPDSHPSAALSSDSEAPSMFLFRKDTRLALASLLCRGSMEARVNAGAILGLLTSSADDHLKQLVGATRGVMDGLVALVKQDFYPTAVKTGIRALLSVCLERSNRERAVKAGVCSALIELLPNLRQQGDAETALATLELVCKTAEGREAIAAHALALPALTRMILTFPGGATEYATGALLAVCSHSEALQQEAVQAGLFTQLLLLLQSDCTSRAKRKSMELLKLLWKVWAADPCSAQFGRTDIAPF